jgi:hypothetical protein
MPTLGSGWYSYRIGILHKFSIPTPRRGQDNRLFEEVANLAGKLLKEKLKKTDCTNVLSAIDDRVCKLYGISQSELSQCHQDHCAKMEQAKHRQA